jgi:hypothetical protein
MPSYIFSYRAPADYEPGAIESAEWAKFFEGIGTGVEDIGNPIFDRRSVGRTGVDTELSAYSMIRAESLDEALRLAAGCPLITRGGGIEVGEITDLSKPSTAAPTAGQSAVA